MQCTALESVQLKAARLILGCPTLTASEAVRGDLHFSLLSSRRDIAKLEYTTSSGSIGYRSEQSLEFRG